MNKRQSLDLCIKAISGNINKDELLQLNYWLSESEQNKFEFENLKEIWHATSPGEIPVVTDIDNDWEKLNYRIKSFKAISDSEIPLTNRIIDFVKSLLTPLWKPAFAGLLMIAITIGIFYLSKPSIVVPQKIIITTSERERKDIKLPDGSEIVLNYKSSVEYSKPFSMKTREIRLNGEAYFSVTKNEKPFVIITSNSRTTVLGTKFDIWARDNKTKIVVKEGLVKFASKNSGNGNTYLTSDQTSTIDKDLSPTSPIKINAEYFLGWMEGKLVFNRTPLAEVITEIERYYNKKILLGKNIPGNLTITGTFKDQEIDSVLTMVCLTLDLNYTKQQNGYLIN